MVLRPGPTVRRTVAQRRIRGQPKDSCRVDAVIVVIIMTANYFRAKPAKILPFLLLIGATAAGQPPDMRLPKKLVAIGWDHPDSQRLRGQLSSMEKRPFDGVVLEVMGHTPERKPVALQWAFGKDVWQQGWFREGVDQLRARKSTRFTDNFLTLLANPGDVDWFDDAGWQNIVEHWRIAAGLAREAGLRGIFFDPEPYAPPHSQFDYAAQPQCKQHSFDEYCVKARQRGREAMQAVAREYPQITLLCAFMNSINATATGRANPRLALATQGYGLYPAFIDGWLDAVPSTVTLVDGCESAYLYNSQQEYLEAAVLIKGACQELVSPENRAKYRAQVQVSFGIYLDAYWNPKDSEWKTWYIDGLGGPRVERLRANVTAALRAADEYVWVYGEKFRWWPTPNSSVRAESWPEALPGCERALRWARDPVDYARTEIDQGQQSRTLVNLIQNGDFSAETVKSPEGGEQRWREGDRPAGWDAWQKAGSKGTFTWDRQTGVSGKGSAKATQVADGCFLQSHRAEPGERYAVRAFCKKQGQGNAWLRVRWQTAEGGWIAEDLDKLIFREFPQGQWAELFGVAEVPAGVGRLVLLLGAGGQTTAGDAVWYDDVGLYKIR